MALTTARPQVPPYRGPFFERRYVMAVSTTIRRGELVMITDAGRAVPCAATVNNRGIFGIALETVTSPASGTTYIRVGVGTFRLPGTGLTEAMVGTRVFGQADSTVGATAVNLPVAGCLEERISATEGWVSVGSHWLTLT